MKTKKLQTKGFIALSLLVLTGCGANSSISELKSNQSYTSTGMTIETTDVSSKNSTIEEKFVTQLQLKEAANNIFKGAVQEGLIIPWENDLLEYYQTCGMGPATEGYTHKRALEELCTKCIIPLLYDQYGVTKELESGKLEAIYCKDGVAVKLTTNRYEFPTDYYYYIQVEVFADSYHGYKLDLSSINE